MIVETFKAVAAYRGKLSVRIARKIQSGEHIAHFAYGIAILTEAHGEITFYSVAANFLGIVAIASFLFTSGGE